MTKMRFDLKNQRGWIPDTRVEDFFRRAATVAVIAAVAFGVFEAGKAVADEPNSVGHDGQMTFVGDEEAGTNVMQSEAPAVILPLGKIAISMQPR